MLANQWGPQERQHPLGRAPLVTPDRDVNLQRISQSELSLPLDSSSGAASHLAVSQLTPLAVT
jgi:hypothetical protein